MAFLVFDDGYRWIIKTVLESNVPLHLRAEFCSGTDDPYYTTTDIRASIEQSTNVISMYAVCDTTKATKPCTHVIWRRTDTNDVVYKVLYNYPLPDRTTQICHILLNIETQAVPSPNSIGYVALPSNLLIEMIHEDLSGVLAYELKRRCPLVPTNIETSVFYGVLTDVDISEDPTEVIYENHIEVRLSNFKKGKLVFENDVPYLYVED